MKPLVKLTFHQFLDNSESTFGSSFAFTYKHNTLTYSQLCLKVRVLSSVLLKKGIQKGQHIGLMAETCMNTVLVYYAIQYIGATAVMINPSLKYSEVRDLLFLSDTKTLIIGENRNSIPSVDFALCLDLNELILLSGKETDIDIEDISDAQDTSVILFTSGSTSRPKAVMSSHYSRINGGIQQADDMHMTSKDRICLSLPIFHCFSISVNLMAALATGACVCIPDDHHTSTLLKTISEQRCTVLNSVPSLYRSILKNPDFGNYDLSSLRTGIIGGSMYSPKLFIEIEKSFGTQFTLLSSLGQTECTAGLTVCNYDDPQEIRSTTVGHFMNHVEGKIISLENGKETNGELGEICVRGYLCMQGYYGNKELTDKTIDPEGFVHTGDLGRIDKNGNIILQGRIKNLIIRGGENISPSEIEDVLDELGDIRECKVTGIPDEHYGEEICACIVVNEGSSLNEQSVRDYLSRKVAYFKVPKYILFLNKMPHTSTGKIDEKAFNETVRKMI